MELRYFVKLPDIACAESDAAAKRLLACGYHESTRAYYLRIWQLRDGARQAVLAREEEMPAAALEQLPVGRTRFFV